jgi:uncharacterized OB-fold protein
MPTPIPDLAEDTPHVVATPDGLALRGSVCAGCGTAAFPARAVCYHCGGDEATPAPVGVRGRVYASTTVQVAKPPYHLAYVDLDDGPRVLGRTATALAIGDVVHVTGEGRDWSFSR